MNLISISENGAQITDSEPKITKHKLPNNGLQDRSRHKMRAFGQYTVVHRRNILFLIEVPVLHFPDKFLSDVNCHVLQLSITEKKDRTLFIFVVMPRRKWNFMTIVNTNQVQIPEFKVVSQN